MAGKLHPPYIDGKVPAFCGTVLKVPFRNNRAVNMTDVSGMVVKLKTVSTNEWVWTIKNENIPPQFDNETGEYFALFNLAVLNEERKKTQTSETYIPYYQWLIVGLYYKILIAYIDNYGQIGYFSDVGVTKYTSVPEIAISKLSKLGTNGSLYNYVGAYSLLNKDVSEKAYQYSFTIYDNDDNIFITTGIKTHNSSTDISSYESYDEFYCNKELNPKKTYKILYKVITNNGLVCESPMYLIMRKDTVKSSLNADIKAEVNYDDGYISVSLVPLDTKYYSGNFAISRSSSKDNFLTWDEISRFALNKDYPSKELFKDFTVELGIAYIYSILQYNTRGLYSSRIVSNTVYADFEDMFLFDGERLLKIRFNPNVSSFKNTILELKTDTIGSQYPFIFRNGHVKYKEFPIAGLISYLEDDQHFFLNKENLGYLEFDLTTDLTSDNIRAERIFKLEVLEWLNNGEVKLFRSPTEGNYLVRLLNVSLTPTNGLGRMLHLFAATADEIADTGFNTLIDYGLFSTSVLENHAMRFTLIRLGGEYNQEELVYVEEPVYPIYTTTTPPSIETVDADNSKVPMLSGQKCYLAVFEGCAPDTIFGLQFESGVSQNLIEYIKIGETGTYEVNTYNNALIAVYPIWTPNINAELEADRCMDGTLTYGYYDTSTIDNFSTVIDFDIYDTLSQWYGLHYNIIDEIEDLRKTTGRFYWLKFTTRPILTIYFNDRGQMFSDRGMLIEVPYTSILPTTVYADGMKETPRYYNGRDLIENGDVYSLSGDNTTKYATYLAVKDSVHYFWTDDTLDSWTGESDDIPENRLYKFAINHQDYNVDLKTIGRYIITDIDSVQFLSIGRMVMVDCYYQISEKTYAIEETNTNLIGLKLAWQSLLETYFDIITNESEATLGPEGNYYPSSYYELLLSGPDGVNDAYNMYYSTLEQLLNTELEG